MAAHCGCGGRCYTCGHMTGKINPMSIEQINLVFGLDQPKTKDSKKKDKRKKNQK